MRDPRRPSALPETPGTAPSHPGAGGHRVLAADTFFPNRPCVAVGTCGGVPCARVQVHAPRGAQVRVAQCVRLTSRLLPPRNDTPQAATLGCTELFTCTSPFCTRSSPTHTHTSSHTHYAILCAIGYPLMTDVVFRDEPVEVVGHEPHANGLYADVDQNWARLLGMLMNPNHVRRNRGIDVGGASRQGAPSAAHDARNVRRMPCRALPLAA